MICYVILLFTSCLFSGDGQKENKKGNDITLEKFQKAVMGYLKPSDLNSFDTSEINLLKEVETEANKGIEHYWNGNPLETFEWKCTNGFDVLEDPHKIQERQGLTRKNSLKIKNNTKNPYKVGVLVHDIYFDLRTKNTKDERLESLKCLKIQVCNLLKLDGDSNDEEYKAVKRDVENFIEFLSKNNYNATAVYLYQWNLDKSVYRKYIFSAGNMMETIEGKTVIKGVEEIAWLIYSLATGPTKEELQQNNENSDENNTNKQNNTNSGQLQNGHNNNGVENQNSGTSQKKKKIKNRGNKRKKRSSNVLTIYLPLAVLLSAAGYAFYLMLKQNSLLWLKQNSSLFLKPKIITLFNYFRQQLGLKNDDEKPKEDIAKMVAEKMLHVVEIPPSLPIPIVTSEVMDSREKKQIETLKRGTKWWPGTTFSISAFLLFAFFATQKEAIKKRIEKVHDADGMIKKMLRICVGGVAICAAIFIVYCQFMQKRV